MNKSEYSRKYRQEHKKEIRAAGREYRQRYAEKEKARKKKYRQQNKEKIKQQAKKYREGHQEEIKNYGKNYNHQLKLEVLSHYSAGIPKCIRCGIGDIDVLCLDHIDGGGSKQRRKIGGTNMLGWVKRNGYPAGYQVLCANCNLKKRIVENK